jgi:hypothetical protein
VFLVEGAAALGSFEVGDDVAKVIAHGPALNVLMAAAGGDQVVGVRAALTDPR